MNKILFVILVFAIFNSDHIFSQDKVDSVSNKCNDSTNYKFEFSLKPQDGYSFILGFLGSPKENVEFYNFEIGFARSIVTSGHESGIIDRTITLGLIKHFSKTFYSLGFGYNYRSILDLGLFLNFNNNFNGSSAFVLRPHIGFIFLPPIGSAYAEVGYNFNFLKNNFDVPNYFVIGFRYNIVFLKNKKLQDNI